MKRLAFSEAKRKKRRLKQKKWFQTKIVLGLSRCCFVFRLRWLKNKNSRSTKKAVLAGSQYVFNFASASATETKHKRLVEETQTSCWVKPSKFCSFGFFTGSKN
jgi:hypothetical protein